MKVSKRIFSLITAVVLAVCMAPVLSGCAESEEAIPEENVDYEIALVTDDSLINDGSQSEAVWNAIVEFGGTHGISHKYYKASEPKKSAFKETIKTAINGGAKIVIVDNCKMQEAVFDMQEEYPEIYFVLTAAQAYDEGSGDILITDNTASLSFDAAQAGYLAGYAAVKEGYTKLGFLGQNKTTEYKGFRKGYVAGADRAADEMGVAISKTCKYCENSDDKDQVRKDAARVLKKDVEVIFVAGSGIEVGVIEKAEEFKCKVIGSITDQNSVSDRVITSAVYNIDSAVKDILEKYVNKEFPGGEVMEYNASNEGIGLELVHNKLDKLTQDEYDTVYDELADGTVKAGSHSRKNRDFRP